MCFLVIRLVKVVVQFYSTLTFDLDLRSWQLKINGIALAPWFPRTQFVSLWHRLHSIKTLDNVACVCVVEEKRVDKSDARTGIFPSQTDDDSIDYGDENYKRHKTKKEYLPVFVPEEEKKKCMEFKLFVSTFENRTTTTTVSLKSCTGFFSLSAISLSKH